MEIKQHIERLQKAIHDQHGCDAKHVESVPVHLTFNGQTVWRDTVEVFEVHNHPTALRCFAWSSSLETGGTREQIFAALQLPPVLTAEDAVRSIIAKAPNFQPEAGKIYKVTCFALEEGKNILIEADLVFAGPKAFIVLEWWPNTGQGDVPKAKVEIHPAYLQRTKNQKFDFFYRGQIVIPPQAGN
jgi:hypothetical protein